MSPIEKLRKLADNVERVSDEALDGTAFEMIAKVLREVLAELDKPQSKATPGPLAWLADIGDVDLLTLSFALTFAKPTALNEQMRARQVELRRAIGAEIVKRGQESMARICIRPP